MRSIRSTLTDSSPPVWWPPRWRTILALALSCIGLGISIYLTITHFQKQLLVCSGNGFINCEKVTTSAQSHFLGIPVAEWGLGFYFVMVVLNLPFAWRSTDRRVHLVRLIMILGGMVFALRLIYAELIQIRNICLWCTGVHVDTFFLMVLLVATIPTMLGWGVPPDALEYADDEDDEENDEEYADQ